MVCQTILIMELQRTKAKYNFVFSQKRTLSAADSPSLFLYKKRTYSSGICTAWICSILLIVGTVLHTRVPCHTFNLTILQPTQLCLLDSTLQLTCCSVWKCLGIGEETLLWLQQAISLQPFVFSERGNPTVQAQQNEWSWVQSKWHWSQWRQQFLLDFCKRWIGPSKAESMLLPLHISLWFRVVSCYETQVARNPTCTYSVKICFCFHFSVFIRASLNPADLLV